MVFNGIYGTYSMVFMGLMMINGIFTNVMLRTYLVVFMGRQFILMGIDWEINGIRMGT